MNRLVLISSFCLLAACPGEKKPAPAPPPPPADTTPVDLSKVQAAIPPAAKDTFKPPVLKTRETIPPAPPALMEVVQRESAFSKFCYEEFGQKTDPTLQGGVAMVVTVGKDGVDDATVADANWSSSKAGKPVNGCLNEKAKQAWKLNSGLVKPGKYVVQLTFRPS
jgi:hypothetical protein